jgi:hypothetical protein
MERLGILIIVLFVLLVVLFFSCQTLTPVNIERYPVIDMSDDVTLEVYLKTTAKYHFELKAYIKKLVNEIKNKVPYIDQN